MHISIRERKFEGRGSERLQSLQRTKRLDADGGQFAFAGQFGQRTNSRRIAALDEFNVNEITLGSIGSVEHRRELRGGKFLQIGNGAQLFVRGINAVDAALVGTGADIELREAFLGNPARMLNDK